jgi:hypothetical protein
VTIDTLSDDALLCPESEFPNSNRVGFPIEPLVSVVVCHVICFNPAQYELIPRSDLRSSDVVLNGNQYRGIICQHYNVLCASGPYSVHYTEVYLDAVDFVSITYVVLTTLYLFYVAALRFMI